MQHNPKQTGHKGGVSRAGAQTNTKSGTHTHKATAQTHTAKQGSREGRGTRERKIYREGQEGRQRTEWRRDGGGSEKKENKVVKLVYKTTHTAQMVDNCEKVMLSIAPTKNQRQFVPPTPLAHYTNTSLIEKGWGGKGDRSRARSPSRMGVCVFCV